METWVQMLIFNVILLGILLIIIIILATKQIIKRNKIIKELRKKNAHLKQICDECGFREITIGGNKDGIKK